MRGVAEQEECAHCSECENDYRNANTNRDEAKPTASTNWISNVKHSTALNRALP